MQGFHNYHLKKITYLSFTINYCEQGQLINLIRIG